jgi:hypothetical protein
MKAACLPKTKPLYQQLTKPLYLRAARQSAQSRQTPRKRPVVARVRALAVPENGLDVLGPRVQIKPPIEV